jgi:hypothetical protein
MQAAAPSFSCLQHPPGYRVILAARGDPRPGQPIDQGQRFGPGTPPDIPDVELGLAHALRAAGDDQIRYAGLHLHRSQQYRLQARTAPAIQLQAGYTDPQPGVQGGHPADRRCLATGIALAEDHVVHRVRRQPGPPHQPVDDRRRQAHGRDTGQGPAVPADRGPQRLADHRITHVCS